MTAEQSREHDARLVPAGRALTRLDASSPRALVLMLHGGTQSSTQPVDARSASWRRMAAMQRSITPELHAAGVSTWLLRYAVRGWNGGAPIADARWALDCVRRDVGDLPVVLLGHSMGGRTAAHVAEDPLVVGVVALAPWWQPEDPVGALRGRYVAAAHGRSDKITSARMTRAFLQRVEGRAASAEFHDMGRVGHYMFRRVPAWNDFAASRCRDLLDRAVLPAPAGHLRQAKNSLAGNEARSHALEGGRNRFVPSSDEGHIAVTPAVSGLGSEVGSRPRVEGEREQQILDATLAVLAESGYDRLTMDAVATAAHASKATLYRRWSTKSALVIDALTSQKAAHPPADTGNLRDDLVATYCGMGGEADQAQIAILASVITAIGRDADFAEAFRRDVIEPQVSASAEIFARARARGEIRDDVDLDVVVPALPGIALHRQFLLGQLPDVDFITRVIDQIVLPAVAVGSAQTTRRSIDPHEKDHS